jgi:hypothetical protein
MFKRFWFQTSTFNSQNLLKRDYIQTKGSSHYSKSNNGMELNQIGEIGMRVKLKVGWQKNALHKVL